MVVDPTWPEATITKSKKFTQDLYNEYCDGKITVEEMKAKKKHMIADIGREPPAVVKRPAAKEEETAKPEGPKLCMTSAGGGASDDNAVTDGGASDDNAVTKVLTEDNRGKLFKIQVAGPTEDWVGI